MQQMSKADQQRIAKAQRALKTACETIEEAHTTLLKCSPEPYDAITAHRLNIWLTFQTDAADCRRVYAALGELLPKDGGDA